MRISKILILASLTTALGCPAGDDSDDGAGTDTDPTTDPSTTMTTDPSTTMTTDPSTTMTTDPSTTMTTEDPSTSTDPTVDPSTDSSGTDPDTGSTGGDSVECVAYCTAFLATCQDAGGAGLDGADPYVDEADCLDQCSGFDPGTPADMGGNTLGCRTYHVGAAAAMPDQGHCGHADADGSGVCA
jgi:hypothetical protein